MAAERVGIDDAKPPKEEQAWMVRGGKEGETVEHNLDHRVVTLGWGSWVADAPAQTFRDKEKLKSYIDKFYDSHKEPDWRESHKSSAVSDIWRFTNEINIDDYVVLPSHGLPKKDQRLAIGKVSGPTFRDRNQPKGAILRREVEWFTRELLRSEAQIDRTGTRRWTVVKLDLAQVKDALSRDPAAHGLDQDDYWTGDEAGVLPDDGVDVPEGAKTRVEVNRYERDPSARRQCLEHYDYTCQVCDLRFEERYGEFARGYMHVHHKVPLSQIEDHDNHRINPKVDLVAVCPNYHAMLHHHPRKPCDIETLKQFMKDA